jgi:hypothetical protein
LGAKIVMLDVIKLLVDKLRAPNAKQDCSPTKPNKLKEPTAHLVLYRATIARKEPRLPQNFLAPTVRIRTKTTQKVARFVPKACTNLNPVNNLALVARLVNFLPIKVYRRSTTTTRQIAKSAPATHTTIFPVKRNAKDAQLIILFKTPLSKNMILLMIVN